MTISATNVEGHYSTRFDIELENLKFQAMEMGRLVEQQLLNTIEALSTSDRTLANQVADNEKRIDQMEVEIDQSSILVLASRQPVASDLRFVIAVTKTVNDLERIGDEIHRLSSMAVSISESDQRPDIYERLQTMAQEVLRMYQETLTAFSEFNADKAMAVIQNDKYIDKLYRNTIRDTIRGMKKDVDYVTDAVDVLWALRALERVGDRACNICEHVVYFVEGKDIRHVKIEDVKIDIS